MQDGLTTSVYVLLPILAQAFGLNYAQVGLLKGGTSILQAGLEMASGWFSERLGEVRLIIVGLIASAIGFLLLPFAAGIWAIAACLLIVSVGTAFHHAPSSAIIANEMPLARRGWAFGVYNAFGDIGKLAFTGAMSLATGVGLAWQGVSLLFGGLVLLAAAGVVLLARPMGHAARHGEVTSPSTSGWGVTDWRSYGAVTLVSSLDTIVQTSTMIFVAFLMLAKGVPLAFATAATVLLLVGGVFGKLVCGRLADRIGVRLAFALIQTFTAAGLVALVLLPSWWGYGLLVPLGMVVQGTSSITYGFAANFIETERMARGYALLYSAGSFAAVVGPLVIGALADAVGIGAAMMVLAGIALVAVPPIFVLPGTSVR